MKNIRHTGIVVNNMEKALSFYRDLLGLKVKTEKIETGDFIDGLFKEKGVKVRIVKLAAGDGGLIELLYHETGPKDIKPRHIADIGYSHVAFTVGDLDNEYKRLKEKGVSFNSVPMTSPNGKAKATYCRDFEGNTIELVEEK